MNSPENTICSPAFWRDTETLKSTHFDDVYFNTLGGLDESNYVFIDPNLTKENLYSTNRLPLTILELGLGTGLNLLLTLQKYLNCKLLFDAKQNQNPPNRIIHYIAIEKYPLQKCDIQKALQLFPQLNQFTQLWLDNYPVFTKTISEFKLADDFHVTIIPYDIHLSLDLCLKNKFNIDIIYFDGFSPAKNPDMWSFDVMQKIAKLSNPSTTFSSFTAAGMVRRNLQQAGFKVLKKTGFGKKREMIFGHYAGKHYNKPIEPWNKTVEISFKKVKYIEDTISSAVTCVQPRKVAILGAGFAGITTALALLKRGLNVTIIEKRRVADGASGNDAGLAYPVIDRHLSDMTQFSFNAFQCLIREFEAHWHSLSGIQSSKVELLPQGKSNDDLLFQAFSNSHLSELLASKHFQSVTNNTDRQALAFDNGIFIKGFLVKPKILCAELINLCKRYKNFCLVEQAGESSIDTTRINERVLIDNDKLSTEIFDDLVLANAFDAQKYYSHLSIGTDQKFGQVTSFNSTLKHPISMRHYFVPIDSESVLVGANYLKQPPQSDEIQHTSQLYMESYLSHINSAGDNCNKNRSNIEKIEAINHRVSARMTTIDRYPIVGQLPDFAASELLYRDIAKGFRADKLPNPIINQNIWLNVGYGSKGFTHAVWGANLLADLMTQQGNRSFNLDKVNPMRHLIRKLKKKQPNQK
jgi:tRNA 5-methylaminomethyl-2-thiouridine biosynthesis bifunctional protein